MNPQLLLNLDVPDLAAAERFYCAAFGLQPGRHLGSGVVELLGLQAPLYLLQADDGSRATEGADARRDYRRHWTPLHLDLVVDDLGAAVARALQAGAILESTMQTTEWGRIARFADPFGHGFCLLQFTGRGYDAIAVPCGDATHRC